MHFQFPKPLHGWRALLGEVGVVLLGVLLALGAQQLVETISGNAQLREFRSATDDELSYDLGAYKQRLSLTPCVRARLAELDRVIASYRAGKPIAVHGLARLPVGFSLRTSVWAGRTADASARMPLQTRLAYSSTYDDLANYDAHRVDERVTWQQLGDFDDASELSKADLMRLRGLVNRLRWLDFIMMQNWPELAQRARGLGIYPRRDPRDPPLDRGVCSTYLPAS